MSETRRDGKVRNTFGAVASRQVSRRTTSLAPRRFYLPGPHLCHLAGQGRTLLPEASQWENPTPGPRSLPVWISVACQRAGDCIESGSHLCSSGTLCRQACTDCSATVPYIGALRYRCSDTVHVNTHLTKTPWNQIPAPAQSLLHTSPCGQGCGAYQAAIEPAGKPARSTRLPGSLPPVA